MKVQYRGSYHGGSLRFSFEGEAIATGLACTCSICSRKGAVISYQPIPANHLELRADKGALGLYQFGPRTAKHYFCTNCGIYTFHETGRTPGYFPVNLGCVDCVDALSLDIFVANGNRGGLRPQD